MRYYISTLLGLPGATCQPVAKFSDWRYRWRFSPDVEMIREIGRLSWLLVAVFLKRAKSKMSAVSSPANRTPPARFIGRPSLVFGAAVVALFHLSNVLAQTSAPQPAVEKPAIAKPPGQADASGVLEGMAILACRDGTINCKDRPYRVGLFIQGEQGETPPIHVEANPNFSIDLALGTYTISSADVRSIWSLPSLQPITVLIQQGSVTHVDVRFEPRLELPKR